MRTLGLGLFLVSALPTAQGGAISTWSGASATAGSISSVTGATFASITDTGATATASDSWSRQVEWSSRTDSNRGYVWANGESSASAGGLAYGLLRVNTKAFVGNPGTSNGATGDGIFAAARWTDDAVILSPPEGSSTPEMVRLQFGLAFTPQQQTLSFYNDYFNFGTTKVSANGLEIINRGYNGNTYPGYDPNSFDSVTDLPNVPGGMRDAKLGTFHLDLPLDQAGRSAPFSLLLEATSWAITGSNQSSDMSHADALSLTGVTLINGTPLSSLGYGVSFASGLPSPEPVPEPASVALWSVIAIAGVSVSRRRSRG